MSLTRAYHDRTKHHFGRFAPSLGYLDWATQPNPFRRYEGARLIPLSRQVVGSAVSWRDLFLWRPAAPLNADTVGEFLRCSLGLSAWKQYGSSRWALRVNPSSGNLHPTEGYVVTAATGDGRLGVHHYAPEVHALEERVLLDVPSVEAAPFVSQQSCLVALTSIHWREAWKYGERAFRYCQHDCGHAIAALQFAGRLLGWRVALLPRFSDEAITSLLGLEHRGGDGAEAEWPACVAVVTAGSPTAAVVADPRPLTEAARRIEPARWAGVANRLSASHVEWPAIHEVARATTFPGHAADLGVRPGSDPGLTPNRADDGAGTDARSLILRRRSAVAFDPAGRPLSRSAFLRVLRAIGVRPGSDPGLTPAEVAWWEPEVNLAFFVHRVEGVTPGIYAFLRTADARARMGRAMREEFLWEPVADAPGLWLLAPLDCRGIARRLCCDQDIASDGILTAAMLARFDEPLATKGDWFYRHLFWECGMVGQQLYLEAEAAGARATGIGCFYDDPTHDLLGLRDHAWQSLYHFSIGMPVEDRRLTTEGGYAWEA
ncbi:MAG: SagB/ThcOx family dehydrogenase [Acidimicrobiia bacterium]|nr:SagB/ThcOx family dehydrogenase [Acidimicrobiia bacterium]